MGAPWSRAPMSPFSTWEAIRKVWVLLVGAGWNWGSQHPSGSTRGHTVAVAGPGLCPLFLIHLSPPPHRGTAPSGGPGMSTSMTNVLPLRTAVVKEPGPRRSGRVCRLLAAGSRCAGRGSAHLWRTCASAPPWPLGGTASLPPGLPRPDAPDSPVSRPPNLTALHRHL